MVRVRFAPSPTGIPHLGNTRTAFFNFLFARHSNGKFYLRIEDTDKKREVEGAKDLILETLSFLDLSFDEEVVYQSKRLDHYKKYSKELLDKGVAYKKDGAIWVDVSKRLEDFKWVDGVGKKEIVFKKETLEDFVILKSDGFPTYHLANVVDDHLMEITHVIRGEEWISSTPKHILLYDSFGWEKPTFVHLPVILGPDRAKLSKRHGAKSLLEYRDEGYIKEGILNFMAFLGWNPGEDKEILSVDEMIELFKLEDINVSNPVFDQKKLDWLNGVWIRKLYEEGKLKERLGLFFKDDKKVLSILESDKADLFIQSSFSRMKTLLDFKKLFFQDKKVEYSKEDKTYAKSLLSFFSERLGEKNWENDSLLEGIKEFSRENAVPNKVIYKLLTGQDEGIGILELNKIYGKDFFIKNLEKALG
jgi:glutamyl/glutaminyl-tRNA synthetase